MRHVLLVALGVLMLSGCNDELDGNNPDGEPGDLAVVTSQGFPCSEREVMTQHYGFDFEGDPSLQPPVQCGGGNGCVFCIADEDAEVTDVDLWILEADDETEVCTWRLAKQLADIPQEEAIPQGSLLTDECFSPEG